MARSTEVVLTAIALLVGVACAASLFRAFGFDSTQAAAWVQAIGSIAAILIAIWVAQIPAAAEEDRRARAERGFMQGVHTAIFMALDDVLDLRDAITARDHAALYAARSAMEVAPRRALSAYLEIPIDRWPNAWIFGQVHAIKDALGQFRAVVARPHGALPGHAPVWLQLDAVSKDVLDAMEAYRQSTADMGLD